jgi:hypothetical protein
MQSPCRVTNRGGWHPADAKINGHGLHVQAVSSHAMPVCAEKLIGPGRAVTTDDINLGLRATQRNEQIMQQVKHSGIVGKNVAGPMIPQKMIHLHKDSVIVSVTITVDNVKAPFGVSVKKMQPIWSSQRRACISRSQGIHREKIEQHPKQKSKTVSDQRLQSPPPK